jgi:DNA-binding SARP family transcriptional activator
VGRSRNAGLEFGLLGPMQVRAAGEDLDVGGVKQRALLALLLMHLNEPVSTDRLVDSLWGEAPPPTAAKMVHLFVSRLRKRLDATVDGGPIRTTPVGYVLRAESSSLDVYRFEELVQAARGVLHDRPADAAASLRKALELWRGPAFADFANEPFFATEAARLEERRVTATEDLADAELAIGRHAELVGTLEALVTAHPLRERLRGQLMLALYRSGRQAEALAAYRLTRERLVDELGIEPGRTLQELHAAMLRQAPELDLTDDWQTTAAATANGQAGAPPRGPRSHRSHWVIAAGTIAAVGAVVGATMLANRGRVTLNANSVGLLDPTSGRILSDVEVGQSPGPLVITARGIWVGNQGDRTVVKIDPVSRRVVTTYGIPSVPTALAADGSTIWVADGYSGTISRIVSRPSFLSSPFRPEPGVRGRVLLAASRNAFWVGLTDRSLLELDSGSLRTRRSLLGGNLPGALLYAAPYLWETAGTRASLVRLDPDGGGPTLRLSLGSVAALAYGDGAVWASARDRLWRIAPRSGRILASIPAPGSTSIAVGPRSIWAASAGAGVLYEIDPRTNELVRTRRIGYQLGELALAGDKLWVAIGSSI